jgi:hypothetical protein
MFHNKKISFLLGLAVIGLVALGCNFPGRSSPTPRNSVVPETSSPAITLGETEIPPGIPQESPLPPKYGNLVVAYTSENDLFIWSMGEVTKLTDTGDVYNPRISPDGTLIAFLRPVDEFHLEIWAIRVDGTGEQRLVSVSDMDKIAGGVRDSNAVAVNPFSEFDWIPGTHRVAFTSQQIFQGPGLNLLNDLNIVDADSGEITNLFLSNWGGMFKFSPDGKRVAITQPDKIILSNIDGSEYFTALTYDPVTTYSEYRFYADPIWHQDGDFLMVSIPPVDPLAPPPQLTELWRLPVDKSPAELLGSVQAVAFFEQPIKFSPDLKRIAYIQEVGQPDQNLRELHLAANDGSGDWIYAKASPLIFLNWSTDSSHFAYTIGNDQETWIGSLAIEPQAMGPTFLGVQSLVWTDSDQFLFWQPNENAFELQLATINGGSTLLDTTYGEPPAYSFTP